MAVSRRPIRQGGSRTPSRSATARTDDHLTDGATLAADAPAGRIDRPRPHHAIANIRRLRQAP
jgi:hypothetical protein